MLTPEQQQALAYWNDVKTQVAELQRQHTEAMTPLLEKLEQVEAYLIPALWPDPAEGVNNHKLGGGWTLKLTYGVNRSVDETLLPEAKKALRKVQAVYADYFTEETKVSLNLREFKKAPDEVIEAVRVALIEKPGMQKLELVAPVEQREKAPAKVKGTRGRPKKNAS